MTSYGPLSQWYDELTGDVPYEAFADKYEKLIEEGKSCFTLLDLCCGTGTLTDIMARRGHEMIGVDMSPDMLSVAGEKASQLPDGVVRPMFLCQDASELDLYGTVNGSYCSLDGINYIHPDDLPEVFRLLHLFIEPGGVFAFDIHTPEHLRELDGGTFVDEKEDLLCLWRAEFDDEENAIIYGMDIFRQKGKLWERQCEEHVEYAHEPEKIKTILENTGFTDIEISSDEDVFGKSRLFIKAVNLPH